MVLFCLIQTLGDGSLQSKAASRALASLLKTRFARISGIAERAELERFLFENRLKPIRYVSARLSLA